MVDKCLAKLVQAKVQVETSMIAKVAKLVECRLADGKAAAKNALVQLREYFGVRDEQLDEIFDDI